MADGMTIAALSMLNDMQHMNNIGQNITNAMTPGYKRKATFNSVMSALQIDQGRSGSYAAIPSASAVVDMRQGTIRMTSNPLDLAIEGHGFFEIQRDGETFYTRQGNFTLDAMGNLMTPQGEMVNGIGGGLRLNGPNPSIDRQGAVFENGKQVGQLKVVQFADNSQLTYVGEGKYVQGAATLKPENKYAVRQGQLENSNVNTTHEMVRMIETMRHFEAGQKVIQMYDEMTERLITKLGEF